MSDPIDRQAAIDALWKALYAYEDKTEKQFQESDVLDISDWILGHRIFVQNMNDIDRQKILSVPSLHHLCDGCKHKEDQNKITFGKVSPCIFCIRSAHDNYEREDADENASQKVGT